MMECHVFHVTSLVVAVIVFINNKTTFYLSGNYDLLNCK